MKRLRRKTSAITSGRPRTRRRTGPRRTLPSPESFSSAVPGKPLSGAKSESAGKPLPPGGGAAMDAVICQFDDFQFIASDAYAVQRVRRSGRQDSGVGQQLPAIAFQAIVDPPLCLICRRAHGRAVLIGVSIHRAFGRTVEERQQLVVLGLRNRIVLVGVAPRRSAKARARPSPASPPDRSCSCIEIRREWLPLRMSSDSGERNPVATRWPKSRIGQQVARELPGEERVERKIVVERLHDPVAIGVDSSPVVEMKTVGVAVADRVEPVPRLVLAIAGTAQQLFNESFVSAGRKITEKLRELLRLGR